MKRTLPLLILLFFMPCCLLAQRQTDGQRQGKRDGFERFLHTKCDMVVHELGLNPQDSAKFIPIYHELQSEKSKLYRKYGGGRAVRMQLNADVQVPDSTLLRVIHNSAQLQVEDAMLEQRFVARFLTVLSPIQLYKLQLAEQKFKTEAIKRAKPSQK